MARPPLPREHGTERGYQQHRYRRESQCSLCRYAHAAHHSLGHDWPEHTDPTKETP